MRRNVVKAVVATVVGVLMVPLAGINMPAYAAVGAPALTSPDSGAEGATNPVLSWNRVTGAVKYEVQVASSSDFVSASLKLSAPTLNTRATPPTDLAVGTYHWRVRAVDKASVAGAYSVSTFTKILADAPVVLTPNDQAVLEYPTDRLVFSWNPMAGAKTYQVQVDDDVNFVGAVPVSTNNTRYTLTSPSPINTTRYWSVRGVSAMGVPTQWSEPRSYQMTWDLLPPVLSSPPSANASTIEEIVLDWQPVAGASAYQLQISPDDQFNAPLGGTRGVRATTFSPNPTLPNGAYFWRVRAMSTSVVPEPGAWSEIRTFTRAWPAQSRGTRPRGTEGTTDTPDLLFDQVELLTPANDDFTLSEPNFTWKPQREASEYEFQVGTDVNFSPTTYQSCQTDHTAFTPFALAPGGPGSAVCQPTKISAGQVLYWRVKALDGTVNGVFSEVRRFMYDPADTLITQTSPTNGATVNQAPVLRWQAVENISRFKVTIDPSDPTCANPAPAFTYDTVYVPEALSTSCAGPISWTVQAVERSGALSRLAFSAFWPTFTLGTQPTAGPSMGQVVMTQNDGDPSTVAVDRFTPPLMQWTPVTGATHYQVFASIAGANSFTSLNTSTNWPAFSYPGASPLLGALLDGSYDFFVQALSSDNAVLSTSAIAQFQVDYNVGPANAGPTLLSPANCLVAQTCTPVGDTPTLDWTPAPAAGGYIVYLATDPNFTNITRSWWTIYSQLTPLESLPDSQAGQATYWFIRPCFTSTDCSAFDTGVFPRAHAFRKTSAPIQAQTPTATNEVTFTWTDYLATNDALTPAVTQEARNYQVQVSTTSGFTNIIDTSPFVDQTTYTAPTLTYPDGQLYWRVRAYDNTSNPLTFSPVSSFTKTSGVPTLTEPASGSLQGGAPVLAWNAMAFTNTYVVEIYKNPTAPLAIANRVVSITTRTTAAIPTTTLPKGSYGWRVQRLDINGKAGPWTSADNLGLRLFTVQGPVPELVSPASGAKIENGTLVLQWLPVAGASRYLVEASTSSSFTTLIESVTTDMTSWAPGQISKVWPNTTIYWRVKTLDATGQPLASSATRTIVRDASTRGEFTAMTRTRLVDTRVTKRPIGPNGTVAFDVTGGLGGVPASGVSAVLLNVTVTGPTAGGYVTLYPSNVTRPPSSSLSFLAGQTIPGLVAVGVDPNGRVNVHNSAGSSHVILDIVGYYSGGTLPRATRFVAASHPTRILDTRGGSGQVPRPLSAAEVRTIAVGGLGGVPVGASSVVMNVVAVAPTTAGNLTVFPAGAATSTASNVSFAPRVAVSNLVSVRLGTGGAVRLRNSAGQTHVVFDVVGWYVAGDPGAGLRFNPLTSGVVKDTRLAGSGGKLVASTPRSVQIRGVKGVPNSLSVTAVVLNVTVTQPAFSGYSAVYPSGSAPTAANLYFPKGRTLSNLVVARVGADGKVNLRSSTSTHMIVSVVCWFGG